MYKWKLITDLKNNIQLYSAWVILEKLYKEQTSDHYRHYYLGLILTMFMHWRKKHSFDRANFGHFLVTFHLCNVLLKIWKVLKHQICNYKIQSKVLKINKLAIHVAQKPFYYSK